MFSPNILTQLIADMNFLQTLYLLTSLFNVNLAPCHWQFLWFGPPKLRRPWSRHSRWGCCNVSSCRRSLLHRGPRRHPRCGRLPMNCQNPHCRAAGWQFNRLFHCWQYLGVIFGQFFELAVKESTSNIFKTAINLVFMETFHNLQMVGQILIIGIQEFD